MSFIDILKLDVEGAEFIHFKQLVKDFDGRKFPIGQLQVEVHADTRDAFRMLSKWFRLLESVGLRLFSSEPNQLTLYFVGNKDDKNGIPAHIPYCEFSFLNSDLSAGYFL